MSAAIQYLLDQHPVGYLYTAISSGWDVFLPSAIVPVGFNEWFNQVKQQGLVGAVMMSNGIHHTLHVQDGWMPTAQMMQQLVPVLNAGKLANAMTEIGSKIAFRAATWQGCFVLTKEKSQARSSRG